MSSRPLLYVILLLCMPALAAAQAFEIEVGARYEQLTLDGDFEFSCTCDPEEDPGCDTDPDFCREGRLEEAHEGFLVGGFLGVHRHGALFSAGVRLGATFGSFEPVDAGPNPKTAELFHITGEVPIEAHMALPGTEIFVQVAPRLGFLNLGQEDAGAESPDTVTFGVLLMAGVRFGGDTKVGVAAGLVGHPSIRGWAVEASVRTRLPDSMAPPAELDAPSKAVAPEEPVAPDPALVPEQPAPPT